MTSASTMLDSNLCCLFKVDMMFDCVAKAIDPDVCSKTKRYEVVKSALDLIAKHGEQFHKQLLTTYQVGYFA